MLCRRCFNDVCPHNGTAVAYVPTAATINIGILITANSSNITVYTLVGNINDCTVVAVLFTGAPASMDVLLGRFWYLCPADRTITHK